MSNFIRNYPQISGLSKSKIVLVGAIITVIVIILILIGVSRGVGDTNYTTNDMDNSKFELKDSNASINQLLDESKHNASKVVNEKLSNKKNSSGLNISIPPIIVNKIVPLKREVDGGGDNTEKSSKKYMSAKSLMYSNPLLNNNVTNIKHDSSVPGAGRAMSDNANMPANTSQLNARNIHDNESNDTMLHVDENGVQHKFLPAPDSEVTDYLGAKLTKAQSPYEVKAGSVIPATMINGLNSELPGQIIAQVRENVYDSVSRQYLLIPQGAKLIGLYDSHIAYGQERILIIWNRLIYPNGNSINLKGMPGTDLEGYAGFHDIVDKKYWQIFGTSFIMGVITGAMQYSQNNVNPNVQVGGIGVSSNPTVGQTLAGSLGQQLGQTGLSITQKNLNVAPTLIIRPGYPFNIMITADMSLLPISKTS